MSEPAASQRVRLELPTVLQDLRDLIRVARTLAEALDQVPRQARPGADAVLEEAREMGLLR